MTPVVVLGGAIVINVGILVGGLLWAKRQLKLVAAERAAADRNRFALDTLPLPGEAVQILVDDESGTPVERDAMHWPRLGWVDAVTRRPIEDEVLGWRRHPARAPQQVAAERLYGDGARDP